MEIYLNDQPRQFADEALCVQQLLDRELPASQKGLALAINNTVIPKAQWAAHALTNGDRVLIIKATQGG